MNDFEDNSRYISPYDPDPKILYTFCKLEWLESTVAGNLKFASTRTYNDIHENTIFARPATSLDPNSVSAVEKQMNDWLDRHLVKCFTRDPTNTLMWAHYADNHQGVCIGFSFEKLTRPTVNGYYLGNYPVRYSSTPPLSIAHQNMSHEAIELLGFDVMHTKSIHWAYEQEHRFYLDCSDFGTQYGSCLIDVGQDAVVDVIFGAKVAEATIQEAIRKLPNHLNKSVAQIDNRAFTYNMVFRSLSEGDGQLTSK